MEIKRLTKENYDELINLLNFTFGTKNKRETSFEAELPKMCRRTDEAMGKHFGAFEDGKLVAALGIYPLPAKILGEDFLFSTVGNVATHPDFEGRGYMKSLMAVAMEELKRIGADASRLGGARQRYNRYGYEMAGVGYTVTVNDHNVKYAMPNDPGFTFRQIERADIEAWSYVNALHAMGKIYCVRSEEDDFYNVFASATAWRAVPYLVLKGEERIGYLALGKDGSTVAELYTEREDDFSTVICALQKFTGKAVSITLPEYEKAKLARLAKFASGVSTGPVCHFKVINFEKLTSALMKLKAAYTNMPVGEFVLGIEDYGNLCLYSDGKTVGARLTEKCAKVTLDKLTATRFLFGHIPASFIADVPDFVSAWLPLPLFWNLQDRV